MDSSTDWTKLGVKNNEGMFMSAGVLRSERSLKMAWRVSGWECASGRTNSTGEIGNSSWSGGLVILRVLGLGSGSCVGIWC